MKPLSMVLAIGFASFGCVQGADQETRISRTPSLRQPTVAGRDEVARPSAPRSLFGERIGQDFKTGMPDADILSAATLANSAVHPWYDWTAAPIAFASEPAQVAFWLNVGVPPGGPAVAMMPGGPATAAPPAMAPPGADTMAPGVEANPLDTWLTEADQQLVLRTRAALQANLLTALPERSIQLSVRDGVVTISGQVPYRRDQLNIVDMVTAVAGEGMVRDELSSRGARRRSR